MELEEKQAQECRQTGEEAPDAGGQEDFEELIRGKYKEFFDRRVKKILDGRLRAMRQENMRLRRPPGGFAACGSRRVRCAGCIRSSTGRRS